MYIVDRRHGGGKDFTPMTIERLSEEELSQVEVIKTGRSTIIEEVITRIEESEKEIIEEKAIRKSPNIPVRLFNNMNRHA